MDLIYTPRNPLTKAAHSAAFAASQALPVRSVDRSRRDRDGSDRGCTNAQTQTNPAATIPMMSGMRAEVAVAMSPAAAIAMICPMY